MIRFCIFFSLLAIVKCTPLQGPSTTNATLVTYLTNVTVAGSEPKIEYQKHVLNKTAPVFVSCSANFSGSAAITWYREGVQLTLKDFGRKNSIMEVKTVTLSNGAVTTLHVYKPERTHAAAYMCEFLVGTAKINGSAYIHSPPLIAAFDKAKRAIQGDKLKITCDVAGFPKPEKVVWFFHNTSTEWTPRSGVEFEKANGVEASKLKFPSLNFEDRGVYWCTASNGIGQDTSGVLVRAKNRLDALWPFLGIVAEVVVLVTAILIYEKKRSSVKKPAEVNGAAGGVGDTAKDEEEEVDTAPEAKDGEKEDVRQRTAKA